MAVHDYHAFPTSPTTVVPLHQRSDIECLPDVISVYLPKSLLPEERNITWREDACDVTFNGTHYVTTISLSECGTTVSIDNTTVTFTNELVVHKMSTDNAARDADDVIIFGSSYETVIPVHCVYPRFNNVSSAYIPVKQNIRFFEKRFGELDISMDQFDSEAFARPLSLDGAPRKVPLDEDLYIRVGLSNRPSEVRVRADQCIATASSNPADRNWRQLIDEGCAVNGVRLLSNDSDGDVRFALKAFDFRHNASGFVFLHCQVSVCGVADDSCRMGCLTRSRRAVNGGKSSHLVSTGPFYVEREQEAHKQIVTMPTVFATVCLLIAMVAVVVAIVGWTRRHHGNQKM
ncbi:oncoprotein-induced transcript 3 protein-like isoform X2 [Dreissena polymorpha]|uniref:oncoprotein-induced transcript 3 protein-like isoform X2 n=1 Tax=Dreissena polymorpha TaxID=45954 RepID=UPI0022655B6F|nr:oncoprotein-induced transcript 3 protein-like isoform X2 [Dreissena polymorpha]